MRARASAPASRASGVVGEVLAHRQVGVERAGLEHDAELGERQRRRAVEIVPEDADAPLRLRVEPGDEREQGGLAGAVGPEQRHEAALRHGRARRRRAPGARRTGG